MSIVGDSSRYLIFRTIMQPRHNPATLACVRACKMQIMQPSRDVATQKIWIFQRKRRVCEPGTLDFNCDFTLPAPGGGRSVAGSPPGGAAHTADSPRPAIGAGCRGTIREQLICYQVNAVRTACNINGRTCGQRLGVTVG
jgi:hypothetical protein